MPVQRFARAVATIGRDAGAIEAVLGGVALKRHETLEAAVAWKEVYGLLSSIMRNAQQAASAKTAA
jgi:hypothetical protein